ncbi:MAG: neutral zinc metallopeptidase [Candidatus Aminicenantales bacterium]
MGRIQRRSQGYVVPDAFTHGTSEQRVRWFKKGLETGDISQGDTFNANILSSIRAFFLTYLPSLLYYPFAL